MPIIFIIFSMIKIRGNQLKSSIQPVGPSSNLANHEVAPGAERDGLALAAEEIELTGSDRSTYQRGAPFVFVATLHHPLANRI